MSLLAFGRLMASSAATKAILQSRKFFIEGCYMRTQHEVSETTYHVLDELCGVRDHSLTVTFELCDSALDNTASDLLAPKCYCQSGGVWIEKEPTLLDRLQLLQGFLLKLFLIEKSILIQLCISEQGYPILTDCELLDVSLNQLAETLYKQYELYGGTPTSLISIRC